MTPFNPYRVLGIRRDGGAKRIKKAFRDQAKVTHPDAGGDADDFDRVRRAYFVLSDTRRRAIYDKTGQLDEIAEISLATRVATCLLELFESMLQTGDAHRTEVDLIGAMKSAAIRSAKEMKAEKAKLEGLVAPLQKLRARIIRETGDNIFERHLDRRATELQARITEIQERITVAEATAIELGNYSCVTEMNQHHQVLSWPTVSSATA